MQDFKQSFLYPPEIPADSLWFIIQGDKLLVDERGDQALPVSGAGPDKLPLPVSTVHYLGRWGATHCFAAEAAGDAPPPAGHAFLNRFHLYRRMPFESIFISGLARQIIHWDSMNRFCGACGGPMLMQKEERGKHCPACGVTRYPRISPAVIMRVSKGDKILLGRSAHFAPGMYSVLAGFVEVGETLEQTVAREVAEEAGIQVKNIRYFSSQPWPFPDSLMLGFTAEWAGGELTVDHNELEDAGWYGRDEMPKLPIKETIARQLIDDFLTA